MERRAFVSGQSHGQVARNATLEARLPAAELGAIRPRPGPAELRSQLRSARLRAQRTAGLPSPAVSAPQPHVAAIFMYEAGISLLSLPPYVRIRESRTHTQANRSDLLISALIGHRSAARSTARSRSQALRAAAAPRARRAPLPSSPAAPCRAAVRWRRIPRGTAPRIRAGPGEPRPNAASGLREAMPGPQRPPARLSGLRSHLPRCIRPA